MNEVASKYLEDMCRRAGVYSVVSLHPDDGAIKCLTAESLDEALAFGDRESADTRNLYLQLNVVRPDMGAGRASRRDVVSAECVFVEIDPPADVTDPAMLGAWQVDKGRELLDRATWAAIETPYPSVIGFTGTGFLAVFMGREGIPLANDEGEFLDARARGIEARNKYLVHKLGGDPKATDVSRLMRWIGTTNHPSKSKLASGRIGPAESELLYCDLPESGLVDLHTMPAIEVAEAPDTGSRVLPEFAGRPADDKWQHAVDLFVTAFPPVESRQRSDAFLALAGALAREGWPADAIEAFTVDVARAIPGSDVKAINDRAAAARNSVTKLNDNTGNVYGWKQFSGYLVAEDPWVVIGAVKDALGIKNHQESIRAEIAEALKNLRDRATMGGTRYRDNKQPPPADDDAITAALKAAKNRLTRNHDPSAMRAREVITQLLSADHVFTDERALMTAIMVVLTEVGGITDSQVTTHLASRYTNNLNLQETINGVREAMRAPDHSAEVSAHSEFKVYGSGPNEGEPIPNDQGNFDIACARMGVRVRFDEFAGRALITMGEESTEAVLQDEHIDDLRFRIDTECGFKPNVDELQRLVGNRARKHRFHPVRDYLDALPEWDGVPRVENWLTLYLGVEDSAYTRAVARLVLTAAVRRIRKPGCKFDEMLILEGLQGSEKSSIIKALCPREEWFSDEFSLAWDSKMVLENTGGKWLIEVPELKGRTDEQERIKAMLTRTTDRARMAYGRLTHERERHFILIGTTNLREYLQDQTGDRRYWPVLTTVLRLAALRADLAQLWAEARMLDLANAHDDKYIRLDPSLYEAARVEQSKRRVSDPVTELLTPYLAEPTGTIEIRDVWKLLGYHEEKRPNRVETRQVVDALQVLGWTKSTRRRVGTRVATWYERGTPAEREVALRVTGNGAALKVVATPQPVAAVSHGPN